MLIRNRDTRECRVRGNPFTDIEHTVTTQKGFERVNQLCVGQIESGGWWTKIKMILNKVSTCIWVAFQSNME